METTELIDLLSRGEDSRRQFKENFTNADALAAEIVAFSNAAGGRFLLACKTMAQCLACQAQTLTA